MDEIYSKIYSKNYIKNYDKQFTNIDDVQNAISIFLLKKQLIFTRFKISINEIIY